MSRMLDNDIAAFNIQRSTTTMTITQKKAIHAINEKHRKQEEEWRLNALLDSVGQFGTNSILRITRKRGENQFIDREPLLFRFFKRLMNPAVRPELSFQLTLGQLPDGVLVAYSSESGMCYYPFKCENARILKDPTWETIQRIFSEAIMDGYSPHYLNVGDRYYTQFKQITKEQFDQEIELETRRRHDVENLPRPRYFDFTGKPVISSWSLSDLAYGTVVH